MNLIVAVDEKWGIGKSGNLLTHLPGDLKYFKEKTLDKVVVMGRTTLESLPKSKPLPKRTNVVLSRNKNYEVEGAVVVDSVENLEEQLKDFDNEDVFIIGGAEVYNKFIPVCDKLFVTKIAYDFQADRHITNLDEDENLEIIWESKEIHENGYNYKFLEYKRKEK